MKAKGNNYIKMSKFSLLFDYYMYIDEGSYAIDDILIAHGIGVKFLPWEFMSEEHNSFHFCGLKVLKPFSRAMTDIIFPALHKAMWGKYGGTYLDFCNDWDKAINAEIENRISGAKLQ